MENLEKVMIEKIIPRYYAGQKSLAMFFGRMSGWLILEAHTGKRSSFRNLWLVARSDERVLGLQ